jgi:hypothetical protein
MLALAICYEAIECLYLKKYSSCKDCIVISLKQRNVILNIAKLIVLTSKFKVKNVQYL